METLDKLYLELSQITQARNSREVFIAAKIEEILGIVKVPAVYDLTVIGFIAIVLPMIVEIKEKLK